jgi:hypothetical protein
MIISHTDFDTRRPLQEGAELHPALHQVLDSVWGPAAPRPTIAEWYYGENTPWATGWLLWSQMIRHRCTKSPEAMQISRKCFRDLNHLFDLSATIEPGLLGKPHGGRAGGTTSFDQSGNPILLYCEFAREFGTPQEKQIAQKNMLAHGEHYFRRDWVMNHHGNLTRIVDRPHTSAMKYFACVYAAYEMTGEKKFRDATIKYVRKIVDAGMMPWPQKQYELNGNLLYYAWLAEYWSKSELADLTDWISHIGTYWKAAQKGLDNEGVLLDGTYDTEARNFTPVQEGWHETNPPSAGPNSKLRWWRSPTGYQGRTLYTLLVAMLGLLARKHGFDDNADKVSAKILSRVTDDCLRQCWDDGHLPDEMRPFANLFGAEFAAQWMIGFWMGREQNVW